MYIYSIAHWPHECLLVVYLLLISGLSAKRELSGVLTTCVDVHFLCFIFFMIFVMESFLSFRRSKKMTTPECKEFTFCWDRVVMINDSLVLLESTSRDTIDKALDAEQTNRTSRQMKYNCKLGLSTLWRGRI